MTDLPDYSGLCHFCGAYATKGIPEDPVCEEHYVSPEARRSALSRLRSEIRALRDVPWFAARWDRKDLTAGELTETVDILLLAPHTQDLAWRVWAVQLSGSTDTRTGVIAEMLGIDRRTVWKWTKDYREKGLGALLQETSLR